MFGETLWNLRNRIDLSPKARQKIFKMDIKIKLYVTKNTWK